MKEYDDFDFYDIDEINERAFNLYATIVVGLCIFGIFYDLLLLIQIN